LALTNRDWVYLYDGNNYREAAAGAQKYLSLYGWRANFSTYQSFVGILAYRAAGMEPEAQALILQAQKRVSPDGWPFNIVRFFAGEVTGDELLKLAGNNDQRTEAHTYAGMDLRINGHGAEAKVHFKWVKEFGNSHFSEYPLAVAELERLSN
ncbi:MAG TPA: hypothetical protein VHQ01_12465, partial [Pyrinomonadaceae bacterium]|nr:hypothetical protein [Pyrinomonadaceae bacterium]